MGIYNKEYVDQITISQNKRFPEYEHLNVEETEKFLDNCETRIGQAWYGDVVEVLYKENWYHLARTTLWDNVCTGETRDIKVKDIPSIIKEFKERVNFGARIKDDTFAIIDSHSDG